MDSISIDPEIGKGSEPSELMGNVLNKNKNDGSSSETTFTDPPSDNSNSSKITDIDSNLDSSETLQVSNSEESEQKPPVIHKKVKLKRSHILRNLVPSAVSSSASIPKEDTEKTIDKTDSSNAEVSSESTQSISDSINLISSEPKDDNVDQSPAIVYKKVKLKRHNLPIPTQPQPIVIKPSDIHQTVETKIISESTEASNPKTSDLENLAETSKNDENKEASSKSEMYLESNIDSKDSEIDFNLVLEEPISSQKEINKEVTTSNNFLQATLDSFDADMADLEKVIKISESKINYRRLNSQEYHDDAQSYEKTEVPAKKNDDIIENLIDVTESAFEDNKEVKSGIENIIEEKTNVDDTKVQFENQTEQPENMDIPEDTNMDMLVEPNISEDKSDYNIISTLKFDKNDSVDFEISDDVKKVEESSDSTNDKTEDSISNQQMVDILGNLSQQQIEEAFSPNFSESQIHDVVQDFKPKSTEATSQDFLSQSTEVHSSFVPQQPEETPPEFPPQTTEILQNFLTQTKETSHDPVASKNPETETVSHQQLEELTELPKQDIDELLRDIQQETEEKSDATVDNNTENLINEELEKNNETIDFQSKSAEDLPLTSSENETKEILLTSSNSNENFQEETNFSLPLNDNSCEIEPDINLPTLPEEKSDFLDNIGPITKELNDTIDNIEAIENENDLNCVPISNIIMQDSELIKSFLEEPEIIRDETDIDVLISAAENSKRVEPITDQLDLETNVDSFENKMETEDASSTIEEKSNAKETSNEGFLKFSEDSLLKASLLRPMGDKRKANTSQQLLQQVTEISPYESEAKTLNIESLPKEIKEVTTPTQASSTRISLTSNLQTNAISIAKVSENLSQESVKLTREERKRKSELIEKKSLENEEEIGQTKIPKISIKAISKPSKISKHDPITIDIDDEPIVKASQSPIPKIRIKPVVKPPDYEPEGETSQTTKLRLPNLVDKSGAKATHIEVVPKLSIRTLLSKSEHTEQIDFSREPCTISPVTRAGTKQNSPTPRITIKPITGVDAVSNLADSTEEEASSSSHLSNKLARGTEPQLSPNYSQKITIKPIKNDDVIESPKVSRKTMLQETEQSYGRERSPKAERIVLKINKDNESMKSQLITDKTYKDESGDKLKKITLKLSKEGGHPEILQSPSITVKPIDSSTTLKRLISKDTTIEAVPSPKRMKSEVSITKSDMVYDSPDLSINLVKTDIAYPKKENIISDDITIVRVRPETSSAQLVNKSKTPQTEPVEESKLKEILMKYSKKRTPKVEKRESDSSDDVKIVEVIPKPTIEIDDSSQDVMIIEDVVKVQKIEPPSQITPPMPKKRGRPRKIPLEVRPADDTAVIEEITITDTPVKPPRTKRSCTEKRTYTPRARRGRGGRGGSRAGGRGGRGKRGGRQSQEGSLTLVSDFSTLPELDVDTTNSAQSAFLTKPASSAENDQVTSTTDVFDEEETRMSANIEANTTVEVTPVKPVSNLEPADESRSSSITENNRNKRGRLEIAEIDIQVTGPEQIAEYYWGNNGPYMLQEQIAQYLGVKSFKRKYPGMTRHAVDMQERDYLRENGLASEAMCDMGLTAVLSSEILDIMFTDFQDKYEEYRKYQREKQVKEMTNKQKALSLATSVDKGKVDCVRQAIRSAAAWNETLNKTRSEQRSCFMDLQTFTVMYPKSQKRKIVATSAGPYPVALVPGQFSDYYKKYSSAELKYLPVNTVLYGPVLGNKYALPDPSDGSCSDSDSSGSDSDSSDSDSSSDNEPPQSQSQESATSETCKLCTTPVNITTNGTPKPKINKINEALIFCTQCKAGIHPSCSDLTQEMLVHVRVYQWQCTDCKTCWQCREPCDDDKMLFCDRCDRGYHIYCVGLRKVPTGRWHCSQCVA